MSKQPCPRCHADVTEDLPGGLCPTCLMQAAQQSQQDINATRAATRLDGVPSIERIAELFPELSVEELIGQGGMGAVYRVRQKNLDRIVALKVFLLDRDDPEFAARFQREARALAKLNHPSIVTVHDFGQRGQLHYLLMEFVDGLNLRQITETEKLNPQEALELVPQLCDALQYAHDQGVIHRDIKPENLLLDVHGRIKIADFGLAKMTGNAYEGTLTHTRQVMGTLNYMAPEQRERPTEVDHRADIYSLGVVIYEMLTGELPLGRFQPPSSKSGMNVALDEVVLRALEKEPARRYQQASEFKTGFQSVDGGTPQHGQASFHNGASGGHSDQFYRPVPPVKSSIDESGFLFNESRRWSLALFSGVDRKGNWKPGSPQVAVTVFGATVLDLTQVEAAEVDLTLLTLFGGAEVIVPRGATVDLDGLIVFGAIDNSVTPYEGYGKSQMRIRIRSYGGFGGSDVRTPTEKEVPTPKPPRAPQKTSAAFERSSLSWWQASLLFVYRLIAVMITIACPIMFLASGLGVMRREPGQSLGSVLAVVAIMAWANLKNVRRLLYAGPGSDEPTTIEAYEKATFFGALIRVFAVILLFTCPALFLVEHMFDHERLVEFAAITSAIVAVALFWSAGQVDQSQ